MNLFNNNNTKLNLPKPEKIDPTNEDSDHDDKKDEESNKKIDDSKNQKSSIFSNTNMKSIFSQDNKFFGA